MSHANEDSANLSSPLPKEDTAELKTPMAVAPSLEDDLDELINSCFTNSPALPKSLPLPPSLSEAPDDDDQFMAWLNDDSPGLISTQVISPERKKEDIDANLDHIFEDGVSFKLNLLYLYLP